VRFFRRPGGGYVWVATTIYGDYGGMVDIYGYVLIEGYLTTHMERCYCSQVINLYGKTNRDLKEALEASPRPLEPH
jgi:hypothetical protein